MSYPTEAETVSAEFRRNVPRGTLLISLTRRKIRPDSGEKQEKKIRFLQRHKRGNLGPSAKVA
jgi:hypothetical protein